MLFVIHIFIWILCDGSVIIFAGSRYLNFWTPNQSAHLFLMAQPGELILHTLFCISFLDDQLLHLQSMLHRLSR
jgi:hypothetical protein